MDAQKMIQQFAAGLIPPLAGERRRVEDLPDWLEPDYKLFLSLCEGGYTDECHFHFFGLSGPPEHNVLEWNRPDLWKNDFGITEPWFFFAEDVFGNQYYFTSGRRRVVKTFWIEYGESDLAAANFADFVQDVVLDKSTRILQRSLAAKFLEPHQAQFEAGRHLGYRIPLKLGGCDTDVGNLELVEAVSHLKFCGQVISQVKGLPVGTKIVDIEMDRDKGLIKLITG